MRNLIGKKIVTYIANPDEEITENKLLEATQCNKVRNLSGDITWTSDFKSDRVNVVCNNGKISHIWIG